MSAGHRKGVHHIGAKHVHFEYVAYVVTVGLFNVFEFVSTLYTAIEVRKGKPVRWWIIGDLTDQLVKEVR